MSLNGNANTGIEGGCGECEHVGDEAGADLEELVAIQPDGGVQGGAHVILQGHTHCLHLGQVGVERPCTKQPYHHKRKAQSPKGNGCQSDP